MFDRIIYRDYQPGDPIPEITALLHESYGQLARMGFRYMATHQDDSVTLSRLESGHAMIAELDGEIIGTVTLYPDGPDDLCAWYGQPGVYHFGQFGVRPELQGHGIGLKMLELVEQRAREHSAHELALDTAEGATHLCRWYEKLGFRFIQHVSWRETNYRSVVLSKTLNDDVAQLSSIKP